SLALRDPRAEAIFSAVIRSWYLSRTSLKLGYAKVDVVMTRGIGAPAATAVLILAVMSASEGQLGFSYQGYPGFPGYSGIRGYPGYQGVYPGSHHYHHLQPFLGYHPYQGIIVVGPPGEVLVPTTTVTTQPVLIPLVPVTETVQRVPPPHQVPPSQQNPEGGGRRVVYPNQVVRPRVVPVHQVIRPQEKASLEGDGSSSEGRP
ncbi:unnamed protein product, partial [Ixodes persulcatus]